MMAEAELRACHDRLTKAIRYAARNGARSRALRPLIMRKVQLEWILEMESKAAEEWAAAMFKALANLEGLQRAEAASQQ